MTDPKAYPLACPDRLTWTARLDAKAWGRSSKGSRHESDRYAR